MIFNPSLKPIVEEVLNEKPKEKYKFEKLMAIKEWLRVIEGINLYDSMKAFKMCLMPDVLIPCKFNVP